MSTSRHLEHLGMKWTGASRLPDGRRVLLAENPDSHRVWSIDPTTGIGEPMAVVEIGAPTRETPRRPSQAPATVETRRGLRKLADEAPETPRDDHGPYVCARCNEPRLYRLHFANDESLTKCLNCGELTVDGHIERSGRPRKGPAARTRQRRVRQTPKTATLLLPFGNAHDDAA